MWGDDLVEYYQRFDNKKKKGSLGNRSLFIQRLRTLQDEKWW